MLNVVGVLKAIDLFVMGDLKYKSNPNNYMPNNREMANEWRRQLNEVQTIKDRIQAGESPLTAIDNSIEGSSGHMLILIRAAFEGILQSASFEVKNGEFRRIQKEDPYARHVYL